ncbi:MAG TPA: ABC transporter permease [Phycisphaerae bacterium]|nr:ABC transporter permease [Phycisphaerae bacterium]
MNLFELILKQMRQRLLSTLLTCVSIFLGMMLAISVLILGRESRAVFAQSDYGFEMIVGPKGSPLQIVMNTVYHLDVSPGNIPYGLYEDLATGRELSDNGKPNLFRGRAAWAVPYAVGDSYRGRRIIGTTPQLFGVDDAGQPLPPERVPHYRGNAGYAFSEGHAFAPNKFEAVIGAETAASLHLKIGDSFHATHGVPTATFTPTDEHPELWKIVGILKETHTANDRVLFIPLLTFYAIFEHEEGEKKIGELKEGAATAPAAQPPLASKQKVPEEKAYTLNPDGTINVKLPREDWQISAILVKTRSYAAFGDLKFSLQNLPDAVAVSPATTMADFFDLFLPKLSLLLNIISTLVIAVAGVSIMVSIYNSVMARRREIAIMRALGATKSRILAAICLEAGFIGTLGAIVGLLAGHLLTAVGAWYMQRMFGTELAWWRPNGLELAYLGGVIVLSLFAGLVPAMKAYQTPVAENLVAA